MNEPLTEFEFFQAIMMAGEGVNMSFIALTTIFFGYLVLSHFAGKELPKHVAVSITVLYSFMSLGALSNWWFALSTLYEVCFLYAEYYPGTTLVPSCSIEPPGSEIPLLRIANTVPVILCWLGSIWYMHQYVRKEENSPDT